jgi:hypothetical protein
MLGGRGAGSQPFRWVSQKKLVKKALRWKYYILGNSNDSWKA